MDDNGYGFSSDIAMGLEVVAQMVRESGKRSIVSLSLGGSCGLNCRNDPVNIALESLIVNYGVIAVVAGGNDRR